MVRRKVKRKYEVPSGTYRIEWANANPSGASHVEFEYEGGTWYNFDDKWMDVFVEHAVPKVTKDGDKLGEMHSFDAEGPSIPTGPPKQPPILLKDSCCCGATKENPCDCMIMGIMECSATCPCSQNPRHQGKWAIYGAQDTKSNCEVKLEMAEEMLQNSSDFWGGYLEDLHDEDLCYADCAWCDDEWLESHAEGDMFAAPITVIMSDELKKCPFCSKDFDDDWWDALWDSSDWVLDEGGVGEYYSQISAECPHCGEDFEVQDADFDVAGEFEPYGMDFEAEGTEDTIRERLIELAREQYEWDRYTEDFAEDYPECVQPDGTVTFEDWMTTWQPWMQTFLIAKETGTTPNQVRDIADEMGFGSNISEEADVMWNRNQPYADRFLAEDAEDYGVQPTWMAETEGPSASQSSLDSTNLTDWANANDSDDIKYLVGGFIGGILATAVGAIAGEWAVQRMKKHGKLL